MASVRSQSYGTVEHIVVDGGSRDGTQAIVGQHEGIRLIVAPGASQAAAVNIGAAAARGDVLVVVNADDVIFPDGIAMLVDALERDATVAGVYGDAVHIDEQDAVLEPYPTRAFDPDALLESCYICQPSAAVRRSAFDAVGGMDTRLECALDYDFWIRLSQGHSLRKIDGLIAGSRMHANNKTLQRRGEVYREVTRVLRAHFRYLPYTWAFGYASWLLDRRDQFFNASRPSRAAVIFSLLLGLWFNPEQPVRYFRDWFGHRSSGRTR